LPLNLPATGEYIRFVAVRSGPAAFQQAALGELPPNYDDTIKPAWAEPQTFDRDDSYDPSWLRYGEVDIHGEPLVNNWRDKESNDGQKRPQWCGKPRADLRRSRR
jgi:hypothetical protein